MFDDNQTPPAAAAPPGSSPRGTERVLKFNAMFDSSDSVGILIDGYPTDDRRCYYTQLTPANPLHPPGARSTQRMVFSVDSNWDILISLNKEEQE
eukprot:431423-Prorocentrum_minimum.AAC.2